MCIHEPVCDTAFSCVWFVPQWSRNWNLHDQLSWSLSVCGRQLWGQRLGCGEPETARQNPAGQELHHSTSPQCASDNYWQRKICPRMTWMCWICLSQQVKDHLPHLKAIVQYKGELQQKEPFLYTVRSHSRHIDYAHKSHSDSLLYAMPTLLPL